MPTIKLEIKNQIARIFLNRPEKLNALNKEMAFALQDALKSCESDEIRAVLITGEGKAFSAGQDLSEIKDISGPGMARILSEHYNPIVRGICGLKKPVVAAVNGVAAGAGANIALCCDIVVAAESAVFIQAFSKIGLIPDSGGTYFLPRLIGKQKASGIMMLGDKINAMEAERIGMIYQCFPDLMFSDGCEKIINTLAELPTAALAFTKQALQWSDNHTLHEQLMNEDKLQQRAANTEDFKEGVEAFMEKRAPNFKGK